MIPACFELFSIFTVFTVFTAVNLKIFTVLPVKKFPVKMEALIDTLCTMRTMIQLLYDLNFQVLSISLKCLILVAEML